MYRYCLLYETFNIFVAGKNNTKAIFMSEQPSSYISKQEFVEVIELMQVQYVKDKQASDAMQVMFPGSDIGLYDNSNLVKVAMTLLRRFYPVDEEDGHCAIEHYCYVLNFGKCGDDYENPEELYDRITPEIPKLYVESVNYQKPIFG